MKKIPYFLELRPPSNTSRSSDKKNSKSDVDG